MDSGKTNGSAGVGWKNALITACGLGLLVIIFTLAYDLRGEIDQWCLFKGASEGENQVLARFFRRGVSPMAQNAQGRTLIEFAAAENRLGTVKFILDSVEGRSQNELAHRAKNVAAHLCSLPLLAFLTDFGCVSASDGQLISAPLRLRNNVFFSQRKATISTYQRFETLRFLLQTGRFSPGNLGEALLLAVQHRDLLKAARLLLAWQAPVNYVGSPARVSPLMAAVESHSVPMIGLLLRQGADRSLKNPVGKTAYELAVEAYGRNFSRVEAEILDLLKEGIPGGVAPAALQPTPADSLSPMLPPASQKRCVDPVVVKSAPELPVAPVATPALPVDPLPVPVPVSVPVSPALTPDSATASESPRIRIQIVDPGAASGSDIATEGGTIR